MTSAMARRSDMVAGSEYRCKFATETPNVLPTALLEKRVRPGILVYMTYVV
jgi:hypothetical protein